MLAVKRWRKSATGCAVCGRETGQEAGDAVAVVVEGSEFLPQPCFFRQNRRRIDDGEEGDEAEEQQPAARGADESKSEDE